MDRDVDMEDSTASAEIDSQLRQYREEQKRRHEQRARESANEPQRAAQPPRSPSSGFNIARPPAYTHIPSAPPLSPSEQHTGNLYPQINTPSTPLYPNIGLNESKKASQEEEDARLARQLQEQEDAEGENFITTPRTPPQSQPPVRFEAPSPTFEEEDEQLAKAIQESEAQAQNQPETVPQSSGGLLSTISTLGRGLYNAYNTLSQAHQQAQRDADQSAQVQNEQALQQRHTRQQLEVDEALARQLQEEDNGVNEPNRSTQAPSRTQFPPFTFRHALSPYGYDSDEEDSPLGLHSHVMGARPWDQLRNMNTMFRTMGIPPNAPVSHHLHDLLQRTRDREEHGQSLPAQRYEFPGTLFNVQGVERLPPGLLDMMHGETDTSYEGLLALAERMQPVSRGASTQQIDQLPNRTFTAGSMPADQSKCGICLSDYETGDELTSLPCLHSFHKNCVTHWLEINKICPVCRVEIASASRT